MGPPLAGRGALHHQSPWRLTSRMRTSTRLPWGMTSGRFPRVAALGGRLPVTLRIILWFYPPSAAFRAPVGGFPVDSRFRQRSIALRHIPPLPIPDGLQYSLCSRMYLVVVHPRPDARGRPFPCSLRSRSCVNLRVLWPLTWGSQGQPSPPRTPHGRPGVWGIFLTSHGQGLCGWPTVPHSMATCYPIARVCCLVLAVLFPRSRCDCNPAMSLSP